MTAINNTEMGVVEGLQSAAQKGNCRRVWWVHGSRSHRLDGDLRHLAKPNIIPIPPHYASSKQIHSPTSPRLLVPPGGGGTNPRCLRDIPCVMSTLPHIFYVPPRGGDNVSDEVQSCVPACRSHFLVAALTPMVSWGFSTCFGILSK